jgi:hypothetical protein
VSLSCSRRNRLVRDTGDCYGGDVAPVPHCSWHEAVKLTVHVSHLRPELVDQAGGTASGIHRLVGTPLQHVKEGETALAQLRERKRCLEGPDGCDREVDRTHDVSEQATSFASCTGRSSGRDGSGQWRAMPDGSDGIHGIPGNLGSVTYRF